MKKLIPWLLLLMLAVSACKKKNADPEPDLPPETQIGADTFGCYINGVPWKAQESNPSGFFGRSLITLDQSGGNGWFVLTGNDFIKKAWIQLASTQVLGIGTYSLKKGIGSVTYSSREEGYFGTREAQEVDGELVVTRFDPSNRIFSGRFRFKLTMPDGKIIDVTSGRFDIKLL